ncbi:MAG: hypothetical protein IKQ69_06985 [Oscillospiraceae bacterium]|nr:hypothetical protein [Oscillospiraceae bacterium]
MVMTAIAEPLAKKTGSGAKVYNIGNKKSNGRNAGKNYIKSHAADNAFGRGARRRSSGRSSAAEEPEEVQTAPREDPYWENMRSYYETVYTDALRQSEENAEQASAAARLEAEQRRAAIAGEYDALDRQLYRDYMEQRRTLPQELAAQGYTGGVSESARLRLHNSYEEAMAENRRERFRQSTQAEYQRAQAEAAARAEAERSNAQARRDWQQSLAELDRERHGETRSDDLLRAQTLAEAGDFSGYRALGWSEGELAYMSAVWEAGHPRAAPVASYGHYA